MVPSSQREQSNGAEQSKRDHNSSHREIPRVIKWYGAVTKRSQQQSTERSQEQSNGAEQSREIIQQSNGTEQTKRDHNNSQREITTAIKERSQQQSKRGHNSSLPLIHSSAPICGQPSITPSHAPPTDYE